MGSSLAVVVCEMYVIFFYTQSSQIGTRRFGYITCTKIEPLGLLPRCQSECASKTHQIGGKSPTSNRSRTFTANMQTTAFQTYRCFLYTAPHHDNQPSEFITPKQKQDVNNLITTKKGETIYALNTDFFSYYHLPTVTFAFMLYP